MSIDLPISKSIANRVLILQALHGQPLLDISSAAVPDDVKVLHQALTDIAAGKERINIGNCGTAMRFLTAYCAQLKGKTVWLDGTDRMRQRPIGQLVAALIACGADIWYDGEFGFPPLRIHGRKLHTPIAAEVRKINVNSPDSSQFISALLLIGMNADSDFSSPYITMTRRIVDLFNQGQLPKLEADWSSAAFWYEYVALHGGELYLNGLTAESLQGDKIVADMFRSLGVRTRYEDDGITIYRSGKVLHYPRIWNFRHCPDLYPAVAITCRQLHIPLLAHGTSSLRLKESDRLQAVKTLSASGDHRIAMALLAADIACDDIECISKSYPDFYDQLHRHHSASRNQ